MLPHTKWGWPWVYGTCRFSLVGLLFLWGDYVVVIGTWVSVENKSKQRFRSVMPMFCDHIKSLFVRKATHAANGMLEGMYVKLVSSITEGPTTPEFLSASASVVAKKSACHQPVRGARPSARGRCEQSSKCFREYPLPPSITPKPGF